MINHIDCFSGPGGFCTGFKAAGFNTVVAIEKVPSCVETYTTNHPTVTVINDDIRNVGVDALLDVIGDTKIDIVSSGMPCETFSTAGTKSRSSYDYRQQLYSETIRLAVGVKSTLILFENVPAIQTKKVEKGGTRLVLDDLVDELKANGYENQLIVVLNSSEFGVPQIRKRFFLLASSDKNLILSAPKPQIFTPLTVRDALVGLPYMEASDKKEYTEYTGDNDYTKLLKDSGFWKSPNNPKISYHVAPGHRPEMVERFKLLEPGENLGDLFSKYSEEETTRLQSLRILPKKLYRQRNNRILWDKPSKTVTSHCLDEIVHPELNRALTVRECARLQGFPDSYDFKGGPYVCVHMSATQDKYEQIGDAVPPLVAYAWGKTITEILLQIIPNSILETVCSNH